MKINKLALIAPAIVLMIFAVCNLMNGEAKINDYTVDTIQYLIQPFGKSEYNYLGAVDLNGMKVNLVTFRSKVLLFDCTEKIYSDPESFLPYRIERTVSRLFGREYITEDYDQQKFTLTTKKYRGKKIISEKTAEANGPIQNLIMLFSYLSKVPDPEIGWHFTANVPTDYKNFPTEFEIELVSMDEITVPAGKFQAYHFKSTPEKFDIWMSKDYPRIPLKVKGKSTVSYTLLMKARSFHNN